ncbi:hypothetical protein FR5810_00094 [Bordetella pertussis]|nr:hypothetical protein FR5810_00094 [Bordetella pertussis]
MLAAQGTHLAVGHRHLLAGGQEGEQVMRERIQARQEHPVVAHEGVVRQHRRDGHRQAQAGHDQGLAHRAGDAVDGHAIGQADADQRVIHAPHCAEQPHERRGRTHRSQHRQAVLQLGGFLVDDLAHGARHELAIRTAFLQLGSAELGMVLLRVHGVAGQVRERVARTVRDDFVLDLFERAGIPELVEEVRGALAHTHVAHHLDHDQVPGDQRHDDQDDEQRLAHEVALRDEVQESHVRRGQRRGRHGGRRRTQSLGGLVDRLGTCLGSLVERFGAGLGSSACGLAGLLGQRRGSGRVRRGRRRGRGRLRHQRGGVDSVGHLSSSSRNRTVIWPWPDTPRHYG